MIFLVKTIAYVLVTAIGVALTASMIVVTIVVTFLTILMAPYYAVRILVGTFGAKDVPDLSGKLTAPMVGCLNGIVTAWASMFRRINMAFHEPRGAPSTPF